MSRPKPIVLAELIDRKTYKSIQVLESNGIWAVLYNNSPINLKTHNMLIQYPGPKYKKVSFSNRGPAINLAKKLNKQFNTSSFTVTFLNNGEQIFPEN